MDRGIWIAEACVFAASLLGVIIGTVIYQAARDYWRSR